MKLAGYQTPKPRDIEFKNRKFRSHYYKLTFLPDRWLFLIVVFETLEKYIFWVQLLGSSHNINFAFTPRPTELSWLWQFKRWHNFQHPGPLQFVLFVLLGFPRGWGRRVFQETDEAIRVTFTIEIVHILSTAEVFEGGKATDTLVPANTWKTILTMYITGLFMLWLVRPSIHRITYNFQILLIKQIKWTPAINAQCWNSSMF